MRLRRLVAALATTSLAVAAAPATQQRDLAPVPDGAQHREEYFPMDVTTTLHADVLRDEDVAWDVAQPVILTVSPYTDHAGSTLSYGSTGPNDRFFDFLELTDALEQGYTYVMVDLPGFGGSSGCNDWGGPREQGAVKAAVEWAASQEWSTGRVGLMGKSYDGWTGLMGMAQDPEGLEAVVSMEPVYSGYRYAYTNGVRFINSVLTVAGFQVYDAKPGPYQEPEYTARGATQGYCYADNMAGFQFDEESAPYWAARNLLELAKGSDVPLFLTQGFLETNTKPDGAFDVFANSTSPDNRAWFGQFDHIRGWDTRADEYEAGRSDFVAQMMDFLDYHLKGDLEAGLRTTGAPAVEVQDNFGRYRAEEAWPPADALAFATDLNTGTYVDDNGNRGTGNGAGEGIWTVSQELPHDVWMAGEPIVSLSVNAVPRSNVAFNVYDIDPSGKATLVSRSASLLRGAGQQEVQVRMYGQDWVFEAGHRIGVLVSSSNSEWWVHVPTNTPVEVLSGRVVLPFLTNARTEFVEDAFETPRLLEHLGGATFKASWPADAEVEFSIPDDLGTLAGFPL